MGEVARCLDLDQIDAALQQALDLFRHRRRGDLRGDVAGAMERGADRPDRAGDQDVLAGHLTGFARQLGGTSIDGRSLVSEANLLKANPAGAERVGFDDVRARCDVLAMHGTHHIGATQDQFVERGALRRTPAEQQCAHGPIEEQGTLSQPFGEGPTSV